jgi:hypothetical protein
MGVYFTPFLPRRNKKAMAIRRIAEKQAKTMTTIRRVRFSFSRASITSLSEESFPKAPLTLPEAGPSDGGVQVVLVLPVLVAVSGVVVSVSVPVVDSFGNNRSRPKSIWQRRSVVGSFLYGESVWVGGLWVCVVTYSSVNKIVQHCRLCAI